MERFTRPLMERDGVRIIIGKGGMGQGTLDAFRELGGAYLAIVGGAAALETTWIEAIEDVDLDDLNPESLWQFRIKGFGPLLVTMDCARRLAVSRRSMPRPQRARAAVLGAASAQRRESARCRRVETDILILGAGGAGLFAALHAKKANPALDVTIAVKGLLGKCGCTRMVQGGYNVALARGDSVERHFMDTIEGGKLAQRPGPRLAAGRRRAQAHPRARERARLLLRPQSRRHRASEGVRRADLRPHRAQGRSDRHRDHQPAGRAGLARATCSGSRITARSISSRRPTAPACRRADARHAHGRAADGACAP